MIQDTIAQHMVRSPYVIAPSVPVKEAMELLDECGIRHLPVVENDNVVGIVSERDLKAVVNLDEAKQLTVGEIMKRDVCIYSMDATVSEVANEMAEKKIGSAIVLDSAGQVTGIFTTTDALKLLASLTEDTAVEDLMSDSDGFVEFERPIYDR